MFELFISVMQGGSPGMPQEEEGVCQVSGEPRGRAGKPEQDPHRGAQSSQRLVLPQIWVETSPVACQVLHMCLCVPAYRDSAQSHAPGCHSSFSTLAFFLKTAENFAKWLTMNKEKKNCKHAPSYFSDWKWILFHWVRDWSYTGSLWWSDRTGHCATKGKHSSHYCLENQATSPATRQSHRH